MSTSSIPASRGGGYARYLEGKTVEPERGDYYLTPDGEMTQAPGRWLVDGETLGPLETRDRRFHPLGIDVVQGGKQFAGAGVVVVKRTRVHASPALRRIDELDMVCI